jgi:hypothetical protein
MALASKQQSIINSDKVAMFVRFRSLTVCCS